MSIEALAWALDAKVGDTTRKFVLVGFANHAHKDGRHAWPSRESVADYVECDKKTISRHVKALVANGWMRPGDQRQVAHLRPDRRPVVYDLAMSEAVRIDWAAEHLAACGICSYCRTQQPDTPTERGDSVSPRRSGPSPAPTRSTRGQADPSSEGHGGTHGGTTTTSRGDTGVPQTIKNLGTIPPSPRGAASTCTKPGEKPHPNCRACGTTSRQIEAQIRRDAAAARRATELEQRRAERATRQAATVPTDTPHGRARIDEIRGQVLPMRGTN